MKSNNTSPNIIAYQRIKQTLNNKYPILFNSKEQQQKREAAYYTSYVNYHCLPEISLKAVNNFDGKNASLSDIINNNFYNATMLKEISCLINGFVYFPQSSSQKVTAGQRVKYWVQKPQPFNRGATSLTARGNLGKSNNLFALKITKKDDLTHEFVVASRLNDLRKLVPNFAYLYAGLNCSQTMLGQEAWCWHIKKEAPVTTLFYENVADSPTLASLNNKLTFDQWLGYYSQILYALKAANEYTDFSHNDLHPNNVLIRPLNGLFYLPYRNSKGKTIYILTDHVATIIDFDRSHVKIGESNFGEYLLPEYGVSPTKGRPIHDAYKLLMYSIKDNISRSNMVTNMAKILSYFYPHNLNYPDANSMAVGLANLEKRIYYSLRDDVSTNKLSLNGLLNHIEKNFQLSFIYTSTRSDIKIANCNYIKCEDINLYSPRPVTNNVFEFYDRHSRLNAENEKTGKYVYDQFKPKFDKEMKKSLIEWNNLKDSSNKYITTGLNIITIDGININELSDNSVQMEYTNYLIRVADLYDIYAQSKLYRDMIAYTAKQYSHKSPLDSTEWVDSLESIISQINQRLKKDVLYINNVYSSNNRDIIMNNNLWFNLGQTIQTFKL